MAVNKDLFGFDELEKAFNRTIKRYPNEADALLMAQGQAVTKSTKSKTPVKTGKLRRSWRLKKVGFGNPSFNSDAVTLNPDLFNKPAIAVSMSFSVVVINSNPP